MSAARRTWSIGGGDDDRSREKALQSTRIGRAREFPDLSWLVDELERRHLPFEVKGDIQYGINRLKDGWLVYLINNAGVVKYPDRVQQIEAGGSSVVIDLKTNGDAVEELVRCDEVPVRDGKVDVYVPYGDLRVLRIRKAD